MSKVILSIVGLFSIGLIIYLFFTNHIVLAIILCLTGLTLIPLVRMFEKDTYHVIPEPDQKLYVKTHKNSDRSSR